MEGGVKFKIDGQGSPHWKSGFWAKTPKKQIVCFLRYLNACFLTFFSSLLVPSASDIPAILLPQSLYTCCLVCWRHNKEASVFRADGTSGDENQVSSRVPNDIVKYFSILSDLSPAFLLQIPNNTFFTTLNKMFA